MRRRNPFKIFKANFSLIYSSTVDEVKKKNAGSVLGNIWLVLFPVLLLSVYALIYVVILNLNPPGLSQWDYVLYIFAGLVPFLAISETLAVTTQSLLGAKSLLKNTVFPIEILPVTAVLRCHVGFVFGMGLVMILGVFFGHISIFYCFLPIVLVLQVLFLVGLGWFLGIISIVLKDTQNFIVFLNMILMIASPIAYTPDMVPESLSSLISWNPFAKYIMSYQYILVYGKLPPVGLIISMSVISILVFILGYRFFHRLKNAVVNYV